MAIVVSKYVIVVGSGRAAAYAYYKLIARDEKPYISLNKKTICLDIIEGFSRTKLDFTADTLKEIKRVFLLRSIRKADMWQFLGANKRVLSATYKTNESAIFIANALAEIDYQTEPATPHKCLNAG
jgi:hypothetical protein